MEATRRKPVEQITVKEYVSRARDWVREYWTRGSFYEGDLVYVEEEGYGGDEMSTAQEGGALYGDQLAENLTGVCAVGAMRAAFAEIVDLPPDGQDRLGPWWFEDKIIAHPLYEEGMRILGKAFYAVETAWVESDRGEGLDNAERLLNGTEGHTYSMDDVAQAVISLNDDHFDKEWVLRAFEQAVESAPDEPLALR